LQRWIINNGGSGLTIAACRGSLDDELAMPASSHSLRLTAIVSGGGRSIARLIWSF
jgi:hypothetical protein